MSLSIYTSEDINPSEFKSKIEKIFLDRGIELEFKDYPDSIYFEISFFRGEDNYYNLDYYREEYLVNLTDYYPKIITDRKMKVILGTDLYDYNEFVLDIVLGLLDSYPDLYFNFFEGQHIINKDSLSVDNSADFTESWLEDSSIDDSEKPIV